MNQEVQERRIFFFTCIKCHTEHRCSYKKKRAEIQICRKCRRGVDINPNQTTLFGDQPQVAIPEPEPVEKPKKAKKKKARKTRK